MQALARRLAATSSRGQPSSFGPKGPVPVALVITELDVGGAEKALVSLATRLDPGRWSPSVIALGPDAPLVDPLKAAGVPVECLGVRRSRPIQAVTRLARALRRSRPSLVQSFLFHANVASRLAAPLAGRPWVVSGLRVAERQKGWHLTVDRLTARLCTGAVCVSEGVRRFSRETGGWPEERLTVIPNAVDPLPFDRAAQANRSRADLGLGGVPNDAILALFVGRLDPQKGLTTLLDAAARARLDATGRPWHLALAGDGPMRDQLQAQAAASPALAGRVHWLGRRDEIPALLHAADLLVLPSLWEGMPNAVLEAMAARRAVVATRVEGTEDLVVPGQTGWLVPPADVGALAQALHEAVSNRERLHERGALGRRRVERQFTPDQTTRAYERLWAGLLGIDRGEPATATPA